MPTVFVTGASGNIGAHVISTLVEQQFDVVGGVRKIPDNKQSFPPGVQLREFDFSAPDHEASLLGCQYVFLLLPPGLPDTQKLFASFITVMQRARIEHVVFISVQGAEKHSSLPHRKIELLLQASGIAYSILRPSYFMENLSTTWLADIKTRDRLYIPAGKAVFTWIAVEDIAAVAVAIFTNPLEHKGQAYTLTGTEHYNFFEVAAILSAHLHRLINYRPANALLFFIHQRKKGMTVSQSLAVTLIHFLQRFQGLQPLTLSVEKITGRRPLTLNAFIEKNKMLFLKS